MDRPHAVIPKWLRRLSYAPAVRRLVRGAGLQTAAQHLYHRFAMTGDAVRIEAGGVTGRFVSPNARDLRIVEASAQEHALTRLLAEVREDDVVLDIGAHHGLYTGLLAQRVRQVVAFEPELEACRRLRQNVAVNGLSNVTAYRKAIGNRDGETTLFLGDGVGAIDGGHLGSTWTAGPRETSDVVNGDAFLRSERLAAPTVVKVDVEGYEAVVLDGLRESLSAPECRLVCCEVHPALLPHGVTSDDVLAILCSCGLSEVERLPHKTEFHVLAGRPQRAKHEPKCVGPEPR